MSSNRKSTSEKPKGVEADSSPGLIKPIGPPYVSSSHSIGDPHSKQAKGEASVTSGLTQLSGKTAVSSGVFIGVPKSKNPNGTIIHSTKTGVSSGVRGKAAVSSGVKGKAIVSAEVMAFKDVKYGPHDGELRFRLIHYWEARNVVTKVLIGLEMLLIDQEETVIQGFIPAGRIDTYLPHMRAGGIYRLNSFFGSNNKTLYRVAEPSFTITFSSTSVLSDLEDSSVCFPEDRFRFHGYEEYDAACDLRGNLYDYVGHIKLVNGQVLSDSLVLDDAEIASSRRVLLHVQTHDGPVMKLYLWDKAASDFSEKFKAFGGTGRVILVTTLNPKRLGDAKVAWFECIATIGDVAHGSSWYLAKISVYDNDDHASFVLLGGVGHELSGKKASELVEKYFEVSDHNVTGKTQALTVTKVLTPEVPEVKANLEGNVAVPNAHETLQKEVADDDPSTCFGSVKRVADNVEAEYPKRARSG
ncbi:hypothetical protein Bca101_091897 [Brassica carinata]